MAVELFIEGVRIDLSDKEGINIKLNTQDINDISKVNAGYSKDFSVMASKVNNKFFKHYYNADITGGFDARTKKSATIYLDDLFFINGKIRLTSTTLENNLIVSYRIQFEGDVVNVKDLLGDRKLKDLDLSQLNHVYNSQNITAGLYSTNFKNGSVIYPLISSVNRWIYDSSDAFINTENTKNIHYNGSNEEQFIGYEELKPAVRLSDIIEEIQAENGLNFVGDFFNRDYYKNLYLWYSNNEGLIKLDGQSKEYLVDFNNGDTTFVNLTTNILTLEWQPLGAFPLGNEQDALNIRMFMLLDAQSKETPYNIYVTLNGTEIYREDNLTGDFNVTPKAFDIRREDYETGEVRFYIQSSQNIGFNFDINQKRFTRGVLVDIDVVTNANNNSVVGFVDLQAQAPDIKQIDLITGLLKMFNIALTAQVDGSILWETLPEWYALGKEFKDFEQYVEVDKTIIKRGKLLNEFKFEYEEPQTILNIQYAKNNANNQDPYGDYTKELKDENDNLLDGGKLEIKLPFEQIVYERLRDLATNNSISFQYGLSVDNSLNPVVPKPLLFYNTPNQCPPIGFRTEVGEVFRLIANLNTPNQNLSLTDNSQQSICFNADRSTYNFATMNRSLYNSFYSDYVNDLFSPQRRVYTFDAVIPNFILATINLNDRLIIGNKRYLINSINSNLTTQKTKLELINDIYTAGDLIGSQFYAKPTLINAVVIGGIYQSTIYTNKQTTLTLVDEGNGIFASIEGATTINGIVTKNFNVQGNGTGVQRQMSILCDNGTETFKIVILQEGTGTDDFDNTDLKWDNTNVTLDKQ